jgi:hypothetical protein
MTLPDKPPRMTVQLDGASELGRGASLFFIIQFFLIISVA